MSKAICGDGKLASTETCDDMNTVAGDGCSANCQAVEPGWQCRVPGQHCIPLCGDSVITAPENCDDANATSGDGCSSTCLTEPGYDCKAPGQPCVKSVCGNGVTEAGETCDAGMNNGLFFGDGKGCSKTCTLEPTCRDDKGVTTACKTPCGDGNKDPGEECDDGNGSNGDGCSKECKVEVDAGFACEDKVIKDTQPCSDGAGECLVLPIVYRDFDGQNQPTGHPDFFYLSSGTTKCVPNASGNKDTTTTAGDCWKSDSTDLCSGLVEATLGADGKPVYSATKAGTCQCRFTDWNQTTVVPAGTIPAGTACTVRDNNGGAQGTRNRIEANVQAIQSAASFKDWYSDSAKSTKVTDKLELKLLAGNQYQFSSSNGRTVYEDIHDIFLASKGEPALPGAVTSLTSGFFPLEAQTRPKVCNIWPYWVADGQSSCASGATLDVRNQWDPKGWYEGTKPANPMGGEVASVTGVKRNFYFTSEVRYLFRYAGGEVLSFYGDDDVWVFINGKLALDLGAPHERLQGSVTLTPTGANWTINTAAKNVTGTVQLGTFEQGKTYEIVVFHADRHPRESNYQLTLSGFSTTQSVCKANCGDGKVAAGEECDNGAMNQDGLYGGCTTQCKFGPFCGDKEKNGTEECDLGKDNGAQYGQEGCTKACTLPHRCGDGIIDSKFNEACDDGPNNGKGPCNPDCTFVPL